MKRITALFLCVVTAFCLFGCAKTEGSGYEETVSKMKSSDTVVINLYNEKEEALRVNVTDELCNLVKGKWTPASSQGGGKKVVTVTVDTQHEITFFDNGRAMIYYGYASVLEKDRRYFEAELESDLSSFEEYADKYGIALKAASILDMFCLEANGEEGTEANTVECTLEDKTLSIQSSAELWDYLGGSWRATDKKPEGEGSLLLCVNGKYVLELFEEGFAKIAELNAQGEEKTPDYYAITLDEPLEELYDYCVEKGTAHDTDK